jgi:hypothetical protein
MGVPRSTDHRQRFCDRGLYFPNPSRMQLAIIAESFECAARRDRVSSAARRQDFHKP